MDGKYGTLSEIAYALQLGKPVIALKSWQVDPSVREVKTPTQAVETLLRILEDSSC